MPRRARLESQQPFSSIHAYGHLPMLRVNIQHRNPLCGLPRFQDWLAQRTPCFGDFEQNAHLPSHGADPS